MTSTTGIDSAAGSIGKATATGAVKGFCGGLIASCVCVATGLETGGAETGGLITGWGGGDTTTVCVTGGVDTTGVIGTTGMFSAACDGGLGVGGFCTTVAGGTLAGGVGTTVCTNGAGGVTAIVGSGLGGGLGVSAFCTTVANGVGVTVATVGSGGL